MLFSIQTKTAVSKKRFENSSASVVFVEVKDKIKDSISEIEQKINIKLKPYQKSKFSRKDIKSILLSNTEGNPDLIFVYKYKVDKDFNSDYFRNSIAEVIQKIENEFIKSLIIYFPEITNIGSIFENETHYLQSLMEGVFLGNYSFNLYKTKDKKRKNLVVHFIYKDLSKLNGALKRAKILTDSVVFSRNLVNEPAITLTPYELLKRTKAELSKAGVKVSAFDVKELRKRKMNSILAVGCGSSNPPYLIKLSYKPKQKAKKKIALVGKGITYDSGGLSIKSTAGMIEMNADMAGSATVIGIIKAVSLAKLPIEIIGLIPAAENMLSGNSYKPGDIIRSYSGKTIEVKDTDAEGRIVLADALTFASENKPDEIIDFATLTGAVVVALGLFTAGLFTKNDELAEALLFSSKLTGEKLWRLPFGDEYKKDLKSETADISNLGIRWGGAITAGKFLEHFVDEKISYAHIDLAGPSLKHDYTNYTKKFSTGYGVRLIFDYLEKSSK